MNSVQSNSVSNDKTPRPASRVLLIGLDGATWALLDPLMNTGLLPRLSGIIKTGAKGILESTIPPVTASAWSSLYTGRTPGHHGVYDFRRRMSSDSTTRQWVTSGSIGGPKLWDIASAQGKTVGLSNLPLTFPPVPVNGYIIGGMPVPPARDDIGFPAGLVDEIIRETGEYISDVDLLRGESPDVNNSDKCFEFVKEVERELSCRVKSTSYLMDKYPSDLTACVFITPDRLSHLFWQVLVPHKDKPSLEKWETELRYKMFEVLARMDSAVGVLADKMSSDDLLIVMSDHGFGHLDEILLLNRLLSELGYLKFRPEVESRLKRKIGSFLPESVKKPLRAILGLNETNKSGEKNGKTQFDPYALIDWQNTLAYSGGSVEQGIFLNVVGREPYGKVQLGADYFKLRDKLIADLKAFKHPHDHGPVFDWVEPRENIYSGEYITSAPDIIFGIRGYSMVVSEDAQPPIVCPWTQPRAGFHRRDGVLVLKGPMIRKGATLEKVGIEDVAPTLFHCWGLKSDTEMDGKLITGAIEPSFLENNPEQRESFSGSNVKIDPCGQDASEMEDLLKGLGYIN
jgi:predicted AlkP superfamily phosphohydrolase/phosphomutase